MKQQILDLIENGSKNAIMVGPSSIVGDFNNNDTFIIELNTEDKSVKTILNSVEDLTLTEDDFNEILSTTKAKFTELN